MKTSRQTIQLIGNGLNLCSYICEHACNVKKTNDYLQLPLTTDSCLMDKMTDSDIRNVAEVLLWPSNACNYPTNSLLGEIQGLHHQDTPMNSTQNSLNSLDGTYLEEVASGIQRNKRMSAVRRFFCCFVLFDLLLVSLTWLICLMIMDSNNILQLLKMQILNYKITSSLFDLVMAATARFVILLLFYGVLHFNTTFFVAFTTFATCIFLIFKVVYYSWSTATQPAFHVIIILMSFIVAWLEAWFFDFRVIPQEQFAKHYAQSAGRFSESLSNLLLDPNLRNPVIRRFLLGNSAPDQREESTGNFYSPLESPDASDSETDENRHISKLPNYHELLQRGKDTLEVAWSLLNDTDWKLQKKNDCDDCVYTKHQKHLGKIFLLRTVINVKAEKLLHELFENVDKFTSWNKTIIESRRILAVDARTDITYQVSSPGGNGVISSRDFVNLRHWDVKGTSLVLAGISVPYPSVPSTKIYTRGENGPCCWVMKPLDDRPGSCAFEFLLNTNLKGWIPHYVVENALTTVLLEYSACLKEYCHSLNTLEET